MLNPLLESFAQNELVISWNDPERARILTSLSTLRSRAKSYFSDDFVRIETFGSWNRNTILPRRYDPSSDVDVMVIFQRDKYKYGASESARKRIRDFANRCYSTSEVHLDTPCVKLELGHIKFDLVPAIQQEWLPGYMIPDGNNQWMSTDPDQLEDKLTAVNKQVGNNHVRKILRLCKYWNKAKEGSALSSYFLESAVLSILPYEPIFIGSQRRTYDSFLYTLERLCGNYYQYRGSTTPSIIRYIQNARDNGFYQQQQTWIEHLLPGITTA